MKDDIRCFQENSYFLVRCADTDRVLAGLFETIESDTKALKEAEYFVEKGFVKMKNFKASKTKANYIYQLTPRGIRAKAALTVSFLERKRDEYEDLKVEIERLEIELGIDENKPTTSGDAL